MEVEKIKREYGEVTWFETDEASFNIEKVLPKKKIPPFYLKKSTGYKIILEGTLQSPKKLLKKGDVIVIKPKQKFWLENNSDKPAKFLAVDIPPIEDDSEVVWL